MKGPLRLGEGMQTEQGWHATDCQPIVSRRSIRVRQIHKRSKTLRILVGAAGFEPVTPCAQGRCATRLRYAPTLLSSRKAAGHAPARRCLDYSGASQQKPSGDRNPKRRGITLHCDAGHELYCVQPGTLDAVGRHNMKTSEAA